jgi:protein tyrosine phosphatase
MLLYSTAVFLLRVQQSVSSLCCDAPMVHVQAADEDPAQWRYIATQGPLPHTVHDFWHMVVEQRCSVVVMLTDATAGVASKCCRYFPQQAGDTLTVRTVPRAARQTCAAALAFEVVTVRVRHTLCCAAACIPLRTLHQSVPCQCKMITCQCCMQEDDVTVTCESMEPLGAAADIDRRVLSIRVSSGTPFRCLHYQMATWPDHGAPEETKSIRELVQVVDQVCGSSNLMVANLSAIMSSMLASYAKQWKYYCLAVYIVHSGMPRLQSTQ